MTPSSSMVVAPVAGTVTLVANTSHAVGVTTDSGMEVLVHIGIDTVQLEGKPFSVLVAKGQKVAAGEPVVAVDWPAIRQAGKGTDVIVAFTKPKKVARLTVLSEGAVVAGTKVGTATPKA